MKSIIVSLLICISSLSFSQSQVQLLAKEIQKIIRFDTDISTSETNGFIIGIIDHDSTYIIPFQSKGSGLAPLGDNSLFEIGGLTKVFTAHLLGLLDLNEMISITKPINEYLPQALHNSSSTITLNDLATHTAGMPKLPEGIGLTQSDPQDPYAGYSTSDVLAFYRKTLPNPRYGNFEYSHYNYALIQAVIESHLGQPLQTLLMQWVLKDLGLANTSFETPAETEPGFSLSNIRSLPWTFQGYLGSLGLRSTLADLLQYTRVQLNLDQANPELASILHKKQFKTKIAKNLFIGNGWYIFDSKKTFPIYTHAGHTGGHKSFMGFVKETQTGVVILARSKFEVEDLGLLVLRLINDTWKRKKS